MLKEIKFKNIYRSTTDDFVDELFVPALRESKEYLRGTGFFSVAALSELAKGIIPLIKKNGVIRIVTSVELSEKDYSIIKKSQEIADSIIKEQLEKTIEEELVDDNCDLDLDLITNLLADKRIEIKIAYLSCGGIYHEKMGYFEDENGDAIWYMGSVNETFFGLTKNVESLMLAKSWENAESEVMAQKEYFYRLWKDDIEGIEVIEFPEAAKRKLFKLYKESENTEDAIKRILGEEPKKEKKLYSYQEEAIRKFFEHNGRYFYEMATGTGKTFTAIKTIQELSNRCDGLFVVVLVPQIDLQEQWKKEFDENGIDAYLFGGTSSTNVWETLYDKAIIDYYTGKKLVVAVCVYDTFFLKVSNELSNEIINKLIVVDEAHSLSANQIKLLDTNIKYRLGLSATPKRFSKKETDDIMEYFLGEENKDTFKYTIDEAIANNFLSKYCYHIIPVNLNEDEFKKYEEYSKKISYILNQEEIDEEKLSEYANARARIVKKATMKIATFEKMIDSKRYNFKNSVIYCGQGKDVETEEPIIDCVSKMLNNGGYSVSQFTSKTIDRTAVLREFEEGFYDTLVAIKCFDQGVDVPKLDKIYILSSDGAIRQTVQRRGRVLRKCKETNKEIAYIYDLVTFPPDTLTNKNDGKGLVQKELTRVLEYTRLSENKMENETLIKEWLEEYGIEEEELHEED